MRQTRLDQYLMVKPKKSKVDVDSQEKKVMKKFITLSLEFLGFSFGGKVGEFIG